MGNCWAKKACDYAEQQVGKPCGKTNEFSELMDSIDFYNTKKNGYANSCSIFVDCSILNGCTDPTVDEDIECAKYTALNALYEPQSAGSNEGAGCSQSARYFQEHGAWIDDTSKMEKGDKIFYRRDSAVSSNNPMGLYHTGLIVAWGFFDEIGAEGFKVIEGNTTYNGESGMVAAKFYKYGDKRIAGAGRPMYDGWDPDEASGGDDEKPEPQPEPQPEPTPAPEPSAKKYTVSVNTWLNVRSGPGTQFPAIWKLYDGDTVSIYEQQNGFGRIDDYGWVCMKYLV